MNTAQRCELQVVDVVCRHEVRGVGLDVDDFAHPYARQAWAAIADIYAAEERPSLLRVHCEMLRRGTHRDDRDVTRLTGLPLGYLRDLPDYVEAVHVASQLRRSRLAMR